MVSPTLPPPLIYGITLSPKPLKGITHDLALLYGWVVRISDVLSPICSSFEIYPEFDATARLHFHGVITIKDLIKYYRTINKLRTYCYIKIETNLKSYSNWYEYIRKDLHLTSHIFTEECGPFLKITRTTKSDIKHHYKDMMALEKQTILKWCPFE